MNKNKILIDIEACTMTEVEPGLLLWHFYPGELQLEDYMKGYNMAKDIYKETGKKVNVIVTNEPNFTFAPETWDFIVDRNTDVDFLNAQAVVITEMHFRILAKMYSKFKKKSFKYKIFSNYDEALAWIHKVQEN